MFGFSRSRDTIRAISELKNAVDGLFRLTQNALRQLDVLQSQIDQLQMRMRRIDGQRLNKPAAEEGGE